MLLINTCLQSQAASSSWLNKNWKYLNIWKYFFQLFCPQAFCPTKLQVIGWPKFKYCFRNKWCHFITVWIKKDCKRHYWFLNHMHTSYKEKWLVKKDTNLKELFFLILFMIFAPFAKFYFWLLQISIYSAILRMQKWHT